MATTESVLHDTKRLNVFYPNKLMLQNVAPYHSDV